tara:strand:+ start:861 stop:1670 length:810 start_codon:yes stop_codon:yes gene_type:complete
VVIGNSVIGGQGKTPLTIFLANELMLKGFKVGLVGSGYKSKTSSLHNVQPDSSPSIVGDEALLMARSTKASVVIGKDRVKATQKLIEENVDFILHDDGLDHLKLSRDIEIIVSKKKSSTDTISDNLNICRLLPSGPWRSLNMHRVLSTMREHIDVEYEIFQVTNSIDKLKISIDDFSQKRIHLVLGIALPDMIKNVLMEKGFTVTCHFYEDHHTFNGTEINFNDNYPVFVTMKDYMKLEKYQNNNLWIMEHRYKNEKIIKNLLERITKI